MGKRKRTTPKSLYLAVCKPQETWPREAHVFSAYRNVRLQKRRRQIVVIEVDIGPASWHSG